MEFLNEFIDKERENKDEHTYFFALEEDHDGFELVDFVSILGTFFEDVSYSYSLPDKNENYVIDEIEDFYSEKFESILEQNKELTFYLSCEDDLFPDYRLEFAIGGDEEGRLILVDATPYGKKIIKKKLKAFIRKILSLAELELYRTKGNYEGYLDGLQSAKEEDK